MALSNKDFQSLLNDADASLLRQSVGERMSKSNNAAQAEARKEKRKQRYADIVARKKQRENDVKDETKYRNRAQERRVAKDGFYQQVADEYQDMKERSVEESKYLGGDVSHTHLVKGLDYALLLKVRSELDKDKLKKESESLLKRSNTFGKSKTSRQLYRALWQNIHPHSSQFHNILTNNLATLLRGNHLDMRSDLFITGRTTYVFDLDIKMGDSDIPTVIHHASENKIKESDIPSMNALVHNRLLKEITNSLDWHKENRMKRKEDRLPRRPCRFGHNSNDDNPEEDTNDNDEIFVGAGSFDPSEELKNIEEASADAGEVSSNKISENIPSGEKSRHGGLIRDEEYMEVDDDAAMEKPRAKINIFDDDDTYQECFPSYGERYLALLTREPAEVKGSRKYMSSIETDWNKRRGKEKKNLTDSKLKRH